MCALQPIPTKPPEGEPKTPDVSPPVFSEPSREPARESFDEVVLQEDTVEPVDESSAEPVAPPSVPRAVRPPLPPKDPMLADIERVLSEDLTDAFLAMPPDKQAAFKRAGEETAGRIREMLAAATVSAKKIFDQIREWLRMIPGINRFFVEQEAKIKTDKILRIKA